MVGVGVIGFGYWGPNLARVFHDCEGAQLVALCDRDADRLRLARRRFPSAEGYQNALEMLQCRAIDLVVIATPLASHFDLARQALDCGKHVLVEKPFTRSPDEARELIDLAERRGVLLAVDHTFVFTPAVEKIKTLIDADQVGRIHYVDSVRINLGLIQDEVNVVWDLVPHDLSILDFLLGRMPERVVATGACHTPGGQVDVAYINLDYGGGLIANVHVNWLSPVKVRRMILGGDRRMIIFDDLSPNEKVRVYDSGTQPGPMPNGRDGQDGQDRFTRRIDYRVGDIWTPHLPPKEALAVEAEHLVAAIERGVSLRADGRAGLRVVQILEACDRSLHADGERVLLLSNRKDTQVKARLFSAPEGRRLVVRGTSPRNAAAVSPVSIPLSKPALGALELAAVKWVLRSGWVAQGPAVAQFENAVAEYVGGRHAIAVSSATAGLHLCLHVLGIGTGDEVIVPTFTFIATANAVRHCGATPVFADVDLDTFNLDPASVAQAITPRTKAILPVHQFGLPADLGRLHELAKRHGSALVEDAACALGSEYRGRRIGGDSKLACFSFHARKVITTGEGGMIVTDDPELAEQLRRLRHHGMSRSDWQRHQIEEPDRESYELVGFNYRMSDISAAIGLAQMKRIDELIRARRRLADAYDADFHGHPFIAAAKAHFNCRTNAQSYAIWLREGSPLDRNTLLAHLRRRGIRAKHGPCCIHREPCYASARKSLERSEWLSERMVLLPLFPQMTSADQRTVIDAVLAAMTGPHDTRSLPRQHVASPARLEVFEGPREIKSPLSRNPLEVPS
jgi:perosamine synthetase